MRAHFFDQPIKAGWITVYESWRNDDDSGAMFSALVPNGSVAGSLNDPSWDLSIGDGKPGCVVRHGSDGKETVEYFRLSDDGIEPLVLIRDLHGVRPGYIEILEEFRLFHNLFADQRGSRLLKFDDAGQETEVVRLEPKRVQVKARELRQFLAVKEASLVLQLDSVSHSRLPMADVPEHERRQELAGADRCWTFFVSDDGLFDNEHKTFSRLLGKLLIAGVTKSESGFWPYSEDEQEDFPTFIIGADENGDPIRFTCDPTKLANYFGANPGAPDYLTPVYFRRDVLQRYYSSPSRYRVEDGDIRCWGLWLLRIDNHLSDLVAVYLGDLGRDLPASERNYWLPFNVQADGGISKTKLLRDFHGEFADPEHPELLFKYRFERFQEAWRAKLRWPLFLPLAPGDEHLFDTLREPLSDEQSEFDAQVLALTKLIIDSLNESAIAAAVGAVPADAKGITKLELYLTQQGVSGASAAIEFLRTLQSLRSTGVGHRKGRKYEKAAAAVGVADVGPRAAFRELLVQAKERVLEVIGDHFHDSDWR
jgi:hypothetical protein